MANAPASILQIWDRLAAEGVKISSDVWDCWVPCIQRLDEIKVLAEQAAGLPVPVESAIAIGNKAGEIQRFIRSIVSSVDGSSRVQDAQIHLNRDAKELVVHYIGNDLYKITLISDVPKNNPEPLPAEDAPRIIENVIAIKNFINQLKDRTK